jgi:hypothetical protein
MRTRVTLGLPLSKRPLRQATAAFLSTRGTLNGVGFCIDSLYDTESGPMFISLLGEKCEWVGRSCSGGGLGPVSAHRFVNGAQKRRSLGRAGEAVQVFEWG